MHGAWGAAAGPHTRAKLNNRAASNIHIPVLPGQLTAMEWSSWCPNSSPTWPLSSRAACSRRNAAAAAGEPLGITPLRTSARRPASAEEQDDSKADGTV